MFCEKKKIKYKKYNNEICRPLLLFKTYVQFDVCAVRAISGIPTLAQANKSWIFENLCSLVLFSPHCVERTQISKVGQISRHYYMSTVAQLYKTYKRMQDMFVQTWHLLSLFPQSIHAKSKEPHLR